MKKQRFSMYVIVLLVAALLAGCTALPADGQRPSSAAPEAAPGQVTLTLIDNPEGQSESMLQLQEKCQQQTGVDLKVEVAPHGEVRTKLEAALAAQASTYDLFAIDVIDLAKYAAAGWALPLDAYITPEMEADILPFARQGVSYQGHLYGLPWKAEWMSFVYNAQMLQEAGYDHAPATWDELIEMGVALKQKGVVEYPMVFSWAANYEQITVDYVMLVSSLGGQLFDEDGQPVFNQGEGLRALQLMYDMMNKHEIVDKAALTIRGGGTRRDIALAGQGAFVFLWGTPLLVMNDPAKSERAGQFAIALAPNGGGGPYSVAGPMGWSVTAYTRHPDAAWAFVQCLAGPEGEKFMFLNEGAPPGWKSVINDPEVAVKLKEAGGDVMAQQALFLAVRPALPYYAEWSAAIQEAVHFALTDQKTVQQALDDAVAITRELQAKYGR
jgi:multiple sugar transport system substrate-binding protein